MAEEEYIRMFGKNRKEMMESTKAELMQAAKDGDKARVEELKQLMKRVFVGDDVMWANEVVSNLFVAVIMGALAAILLVTLLLSELGVYSFNNTRLFWDLSVCFAELTVGIVLFFVTKGEKRWLKYVLMLVVCLTIGTTSALLGYRAAICVTLPVILSTKYLSHRFTWITACFSGFLLLVSSICTVWLAVAPDLNGVALAQGTQLVIDTSLSSAVQAVSVETGATLKNMLMRSFLPNLFQFMLISWICLTIAKWGGETVRKQEEVSKEFARVDTELNMAKEIQAHMLPHIFPAFPDRPELDIHASMDPAKEVGGDFYDFFLVDDDHLALVMADVSGKGMPAALFMMIGKTLIKNQALTGASPAEILRIVNRQLCDNNESNLFITAWVGILEISTGKLTAANAGHEYPILRTGGGKYEVLHDRHGFVLGGMEMSRYKEYELVMKPGDSLFVYTDGVPEATNAGNELYGMERLVEALNSCAGTEAERVLSTIRGSVDTFVGSAPQFDDLTMLGMTYHGPTEKTSR